MLCETGPSHLVNHLCCLLLVVTRRNNHTGWPDRWWGIFNLVYITGNVHSPLNCLVSMTWLMDIPLDLIYDTHLLKYMALGPTSEAIYRSNYLSIHAYVTPNGLHGSQPAKLSWAEIFSTAYCMHLFRIWACDFHCVQNIFLASKVRTALTSRFQALFCVNAARQLSKSFGFRYNICQIDLHIMTIKYFHGSDIVAASCYGASSANIC